MIDPETFRGEACAFLEGALRRRGDVSSAGGSDSVALFHDLLPEEERAMAKAGLAWQRRKFEAGFGAITWPEEHGGRGLPELYDEIFAEEELQFDVPWVTEVFPVTLRLVAPMILQYGSTGQRARFLPPFLGGQALACQLFSEPEAGSDLAASRTRAVREGGGWVVTGQKVWTSGARVADFGELIARTDPDVPKHRGLTAFIVPMDAPGVNVRPIRQMTGGASFNEVFLDRVFLSDDLRLGPIGEGWSVALSTLTAERTSSAHLAAGRLERLIDLARTLDLNGDALVRQELASLAARTRALDWLALRHRTRRGNVAAAGPEGSLEKLAATRNLSAISDALTRMLGLRLVADTGERGTYAWASHVLGAPGYRIAGGSDEIQRTIIAERLLGLPRG